jgi:hypothetical protein
LIALQHALESLPRGTPAERRDELYRAETRWRFQHAARVWGVLGETIINEATQKYACDLIDARWHCGFLRDVSIRNAGNYFELLARTLPRLEVAALVRKLVLVDADWGPGTLEIAAAARWPALQSLEIVSDSGAFERANLDATRIVPFLAMTPKLVRLVAMGTHTTDTLCTAIAGDPLADRLESLVLYDARLTEVGIRALADGRFPALTELKLSGLGPPTARETLAGKAARVNVALEEQLAEEPPLYDY